MSEYEPRTEEGVHLSSYTLEVTEWIQRCFELLDAGDEDRIIADPFYERAGGKPPLTDEEVDGVIEVLEAEYAHELGTYPGYHRNRSGANALPEFHRLSARGRRAMVEGIDRIVQKYRAETPSAAGAGG